MYEFNTDLMPEKDLLEAAKTIFSVQEQDFEKIKSEKWYQSLFHAITLNQDGKKYIVRDITSLAKLQKLFMSIYVRNYHKSYEQLDSIIETVTNNSITIKKLYGFCVLDLEKQEDLDSLSSQDAMILSLFLGEYRDEQGNVPDIVRDYNRGVLIALNQKMPIGKLENHQLRKLQSPKIVYRCFMEQCAVDGTIDTQEWSDNIYENLRDFELSENTKSEIRASVKREAEIAGVEYFVVKYSKEHRVGILDTDFVSDSDSFASGEETLENSSEVSEEVIGSYEKRDDYRAPSIVEIPRDKSIKIINKIIFVTSFITIYGRLQIENCVIYYNVDSNRGSIELLGSASLSVKNTLIICKGFNKTPLVSSKGNGTSILLEKCTLNDCNYLFNLDSFSTFKMTYCQINNAGQELLYAYHRKETDLSVDNCYFKLSGLSEFNMKESSVRSILITRYSSDTKVYTFSNCLFNQYNPLRKNGDFGYTFVDADYTQINNCTIIGLQRSYLPGFRNAMFYDDKFIASKYPIELISSQDAPSKIEHCLFNNCISVITLSGSSIIRNCQFISCTNGIIKGSWEGGDVIEYCEFLNLKRNSSKKFDDSSSIFPNDAFLTFRRSQSLSALENKISHCIFNGVTTGEWLLIDIEGYEKPSGNVLQLDTCSFSNCKTNRKTLIGEYINYNGLFNISKSFKAFW